MSEYNGKRVLPYEGNENYIFISYSHKDTEIVLPILEYLEKEGFRFWYDEGIDPGSEWPESIATHLSNAKVCIAFMSQDSLASNNCRREINFALSKNKEFLSVILKPVEMTPGVEMQISTYQSLLKYKYQNEEEFLKRLVKVETIQSCRKQKQEKVLEEKQEEVIIKTEVIEEPKIIDVETEIIEEKPKKVKTKPVKKVKKEKIKEAKPQNNKNKLLIPIIALCLVIVLVFVFIPKKVNIQGVDYAKKESSYQFIDMSLTGDDLEKISSFDEAITLHFENVTFENNSYKTLANMSEISTLYLINCNGINDLSFINEMSNLRNLQVNNCGLTDEMFENVSSDTVYKLVLSNNQLTKIPSGFNGEKIIEIDISNNKVTNTRALENYKALETLNVSNNQIITLSNIDNCVGLKRLVASNNKISSTQIFTNLIRMRELYLDNNNLTTIIGLKYMEELVVLNLSGNSKIDDFSNISNSSSTLERIGLQNLNLENLDFLSECTKLTKIYADNSNLKDISAIKNCTDMYLLSVSNNKIEDISCLSNFTNLKFGNFANNKITSLNGLQNMGKEQKDIRLNFLNNELTSLNGLPTIKIYNLMLCGNPLKDIAALNGRSGYQIAFDGTSDFPVESLRNIDYVVVYMVDLDVSIQKDVEEILGAKIRKETLESALHSIFDYQFDIML